MDNKIGYWFHLFPITPLETTLGSELIVKLPSKHDKYFPDINCNNCKIYDYKDNYNFFFELAKGDIKIVMLNSVNITELHRLTKKCDYCFVTVETKGYPIRSCEKCDKYMCSLCYEEKTEEIALKNGAKNWIHRKEELLKCFEHLDNIKICENLPVNCDLCSQKSKTCLGTWRCNREKDKDICPNCFYTDKGQNFISDNRGKWNNIYYGKDHKDHNFGSLLDWIIILENEEKDYVLYNNIQNSYNYNKIA
jgi:hypothetical protein